MNTAPMTSASLGSTTDRLNAICDAQPFITRFCIKNLRTGDVFERGADEETPSASTRKTSIMMAALKAVHEGGSISMRKLSTKRVLPKKSQAECFAI